MLMFIIVLKFVLPHWKLLTVVFLLKILEILFCLLLVPHVKIVTPQDVHQPQIPCANILTYLVNIWLHLTIF
jgi:hypothetical protein